MKKLIFFFMFCSSAIYAQTLIPDVNFEQALIDLSLDSGTPDGMVSTNVINQITDLDIHGKSIANLAGIEDFAALEFLDCGGNDLQSLDVSNLSNLKRLDCYGNQLSNLDVAANFLLERLDCSKNQISQLTVANNTQLIDLTCDHNELTTLDLSSNTVLENLYCYKNELTFLNVKNGNNALLKNFHAGLNQLDCIQVDNAAEATAHTGVYRHWVYDNNEGTNVEYVESCNAPLASEWLNFVVKKSGQSALLKWEIVPHQSIEHFAIEHSKNGHTFHNISQMRASDLIHHEYLDHRAAKGENYYRISALERNGRSSYSQVVLFYLDLEEKEELLLFPNPVQNVLTLSTYDESMLSSVRIYNQIGEEVFFKSAPLQQINIQHLPKGMYILEAYLNGKTIKKSFVK